MARKLIIFDLDGTLYKIRGGSFRNSGFYQAILRNAGLLIQERLAKTAEEAELILADIKERYGEDISLAVEKEYGIDRYEYFERVWDLPVADFIDLNPKVLSILNELSRRYDLLIMSDAPKVWVTKALQLLGVTKLFAGRLHTGESDIRKGLGNAFENILEKYQIRAEDCISIGDQLKTDIVPAKRLGIKTILVADEDSEEADFVARNVDQWENILQKIENEFVFEKYLQENRLEFSEAKKLSGSSRASIYLLRDKIYKVGPIAEFEKEATCYARFAEKLDFYNEIFPKLELLKRESDLVIWSLEYVGEITLEQFIKNLRGVAVEQRSQYIEKIGEYNEQVLGNLRRIFEKTKKVDECENALFFEELLNSLRLNLQKAGLGDCEKNLNQFQSEAFVNSVVHKDLSVVNIILNKDKDKIYFIDPRRAVPYGENSEAMGSVAIDLAGYFVSMSRKELELRKFDQTISLAMIFQRMENEVKKYIEEGIFSRQFWNLCLTLWYSVYAACKCDYCTAPERVWLYEEMRNRLIEKL
jgi:putative hydrolase of the HAD superfamily